MGVYTEILYSDNINSIASTVKSIIQPLKSFGFNGTTDKTEAVSIFSILLGQRAQAALIGGVTNGNYLLDTGVNVYNGMYEECFIVDTDKYKIDLPLFVFTAMFLESSNKRESLKVADVNLRGEFFECIYDVCKEAYPTQAQFNRIDFGVMLDKFCSFLIRKYKV